MGREHHPAGPGPHRLGLLAQALDARRVEDEGRLGGAGEQRGGERPGRRAGRHAGADQDRGGPLGAGQEHLGGDPVIDMAVRTLGQAHHQGLGHREGGVRRGAGSDRHLQLAGAGPERRGAGEDRGARNLDRAGDHEGAAAGLLGAGAGIRQGIPAQGRGLDLDGHRAAPVASGSAVTGAPACRRGATTL
jgi:hypothetical protein